MDNKLNCMMLHMKNTIFKWQNWKKFIIETGLYHMIINKGKENHLSMDMLSGGDMRTKFDMKKDKIEAWYMVNFGKEEWEPVRLSGFEEMRSRTAKHASRTE